MTDDWDGAAGTGFVRDGKVVEGRDGFLFLAHDVNDVLAQHTGELRLDREQLERWRVELESRTQTAGRKGCSYLLMIIPDSHSVYPEMLPPGIESAPERPVHQLIAHLEQAGSPVRPLYPLEEMIAGKAHDLVCSPTDSHWTDYGAFLAYRRLAGEARTLVPMRVVAPDDVVFSRAAVAGDLGHKLGPARSSLQPVGHVRNCEARLIYDNCIQNTGTLLVTACRAAPNTTCLLLGDSYCAQLTKWMAESFGRLVVSQSPTLDPELLDAAQPDLLVTAIAERFLISPPTGKPSPTLRERERRKRELSAVRPPRLNWIWPVFVTVTAVERMRACLLRQGNTRDAALLSLLAYVGLRPDDALGLRWSSIGPDSIAVPPSRVPLLRPVAQDLETWRIDSRAGDSDRVFSEPGKPWTLDWGNWKDWRATTYDPVARAAEVSGAPPGSLRSVISRLLIDAGAADVDVAAFVSGSTASVDDADRGEFGKAWGSVEREIMGARLAQAEE